MNRVSNNKKNNATVFRCRQIQLYLELGLQQLNRLVFLQQHPAKFILNCNEHNSKQISVEATSTTKDQKLKFERLVSLK